MNRELESMLHDPDLHQIGFVAELRPLMAKLLETAPTAVPPNPRRWHGAAQEYAQAFREIPSRNFDPDRTRAHWQYFEQIGSASLPAENS